MSERKLSSVLATLALGGMLQASNTERPPVYRFIEKPASIIEKIDYKLGVSHASFVRIYVDNTFKGSGFLAESDKGYRVYTIEHLSEHIAKSSDNITFYIPMLGFVNTPAYEFLGTAKKLVEVDPSGTPAPEPDGITYYQTDQETSEMVQQLSNSGLLTPLRIAERFPERGTSVAIPLNDLRDFTYYLVGKHVPDCNITLLEHVSGPFVCDGDSGVPILVEDSTAPGGIAVIGALSSIVIREGESYITNYSERPERNKCSRLLGIKRITGDK